MNISPKSFYMLRVIEEGTFFCKHTWINEPKGRTTLNGQYTKERYCFECNRRERWMRKASSLTAAEKRAAKAIARTRGF